MLWLRRIEPILRPLIRAGFRLARGMTLGVRGLVIDSHGRVLLVEHTYIPGWHLPGGGVEPRESAEQSVARELLEEAGILLTGRPRLLSIHNHDRQHPRDHVLIYRCDQWREAPATSRGEIHRRDWFAPDALPDSTTAPTRARIREALGGEGPDPLW